MRDNKVKVPLYIQTACNLREEIKKGYLASGEMISNRKVAEKYGVSRKTVAEALDILQSEGYVVIKPQVGTFVNGDVWFPLLERHTPQWAELIKNSSSVPSSDKIYSLLRFISSSPVNHIGGTSISKDFNFHKLIKTAMERAAQRIGSSNDIYNVNMMGMLSLRESIVKHMAVREVKCESRDVLVTAGPMEALSIVMLSLLRRGMKLFIEETSILGTPNLAQLTGADIRRVACDENGMIVDDLIEQLRKTKSDAIVCISPVNQYPTGSVLSKARRDLIMSTCASKNIPIIEYDLLRDYNRQAYPRPLRSFDTNDLVIYIGSLLSSYQNMKLGWIIAPPQLMAHITDIKIQYEINMNTMNQIVADELLSSGLYAEYVEENTPHFIERLRLCRMFFEKYFTGKATWSTDPEAFYQWLDFGDKIKTYELVKHLKNTFVHPGFFFNSNDTGRIYINPMGDSVQNLENGLIEIANVAKNF